MAYGTTNSNLDYDCLFIYSKDLCVVFVIIWIYFALLLILEKITKAGTGVVLLLLAVVIVLFL